jgi:hypothetical protein
VFDPENGEGAKEEWRRGLQFHTRYLREIRNGIWDRRIVGLIDIMDNV